MIDMNTRIEMREMALRELQAEHAELWESWKVVESKAQPIAALAGVFLAGVFTYLGQLPPAATKCERWMLLAIAALLVGCAISALSAIWVKSVALPYLSSEGVKEVDDLLREVTDADEMAKRRERMIMAAIDRWTNACARIREGLKRKQDLLTACLVMLCASAAAAVPLTYFTLFARAAT